MQLELRAFAPLLAASVGLGATPHGGCPGSAPHPDDRAAWAETHLRWVLGELEPPLDEHGNALIGRTVLLPIPPTPGDGTPGSAAVTLGRRESFTLELWGLVGTTYSDGTPPDPFEPVSIFETLDIRVSLDGVDIITQDNVLDFFARFALEPPIPLDEPPLAAAIWYESVGLFQPHLPPGTHTLELYAVNTEPAFGGFFEYDNTWTLTVVDD